MEAYWRDKSSMGTCSTVFCRALFTAGYSSNLKKWQARIRMTNYPRSPKQLAICATSILRHPGINSVRPCQHATGKVFRLGEALLLEKFHCLSAASSGAAMHHHLFAGIKLIHTLR